MGSFKEQSVRDIETNLSIEYCQDDIRDAVSFLSVPMGND